MDTVAATRGFAQASTPSYGHGHSHGGDAADAEKITVTFIEKDGTETVVQVGFFIFIFSLPFPQSAMRRASVEVVCVERRGSFRRGYARLVIT